MTTDRPATLQAALASLWDKHRQTNLDRITMLEDAATAVLRGALDEAERDGGERAAHKLAGSLGTFGLEHAARRALEIEALLRAPQPDALRLAEAVEALRRSVLEHRATAPETSAPSSSDDAGVRALVAIAKDPDLGSLLVADAAASGMSVTIVEDLPAARAVLAYRHVDAVLFDVAATSTSDDSLMGVADLAARVPLFVLSDSDRFSDRLDASRAGVAGFLPRRQSARQTIAFVAQVLAEQAPHPAVILAVDDDPVALDIVELVLAEPGRQIVTLADPLEFWAELERLGPTLVLADLDMPGLNGLELCRMIRADPRWHRLPVVMLTAGTDPDVLRRAFAAGADDYVAKPIVDVELQSRVRAQVERTRLLRALSAVDPVTGTENRRAAEQSLDRLLRLAARRGDPLTVALVDVDLDELREHSGSTTANAVLRRWGMSVRASVRSEDVVGRWDVGEFIIGMYGTETAAASERMTKLLEVLTSEVVGGTTRDPSGLTLSAGIASFPIDGTSVDTLVWSAENALHEAKRHRAGVVASTSLGRFAGTDHYDVVVVDDDESIADIVVQTLQRRGYRVHRMTDGADAAEALGSGRVSARLVLLDLGLPGLDGFGVLRVLGDRGVLESTPVIVLSARSTEAETLRALGLGATEHITKPFSLPVLTRRVEHALDAARRES